MAVHRPWTRVLPRIHLLEQRDDAAELMPGQMTGPAYLVREQSDEDDDRDRNSKKQKQQ
jgi:hypothetical protein